MRRLALLPFVMLAFACDGASDGLLEPQGPSFSAGPGPVIASATGSGMRFRLPEDDYNVAYRTLAFTAKKHSDGTVKGQVQLVIHRNASPNEDRASLSSFAKASGKVTCLSVDGNRAWIGGFFTHGRWIEGPIFDYSGFLFYAEDNGEGANALPDVLSGLFNDVPDDVVEWWCDDMPDPDDPENSWIQVFDIEAGNIQVEG